MSNVAVSQTLSVGVQNLVRPNSLLRQPNYGTSISPKLQRPKQRILNTLAAKLPAEIHFALHEVALQKGQTIYDFGDPVNFVYFPQNCVTMHLKLLEDGSMIEVGMTGREGMLGINALLGDSTANDLVIAEIGGKALRLRVDILRECFRRSEDCQKHIFKFYQNFLGQVAQRSACRCRHSIAEQLSTWLLLLNDRMRGRDLLLTHETIARRLGARRSGITVAINELENAKAVKCGRGRISIDNRQELESRACECFSVLREAM